MPNFAWELDPVFFRLTIPLLPILLVVAAIGVIGALFARRHQDQNGERFGWFVAVAAVASALIWREERPELELRYYSLLFVGVFLGGYALLNWQIKRGGGDEEEAGDFIVYGVIGVLGGARLGHVLFYDLDHALRDPVWVLKIWTGGLASHGAVVGLIVAMYLFTKRRGVTFLEGSDRFSYSCALGAALVRLGNFFNSEIVGSKVADQSWGVRFPRYLPDQRLEEVPLRHPSQLYEVALGLVVLGALYVFDRAFGKEKRPRGVMIALFFALYFTGRFFIEFVKEYQTLPKDSMLTMGQWLSIPGALLGYYGVRWSLQRRLPVGWSPRGEEEEIEEDDFDEEDLAEEPRGALHDPDVDEEFGPREPVRRRKKKKRRRKPKAREEGEEEPQPKPKKKRKKKKTKKPRPARDE